MYHDSPRSVSSKYQGFDDDDDQAWAHWEYSPEEWVIFDRVDWQAAWLRYWLPNLIPLVCLFLLFLLGVFVFHVPVLGMLLMIVPLPLSLVVALFVARGYFYRDAIKRHQARQNRAQPQRVTFSKKGVWEAGTYFPFLALRGVRMTSQPAVLHFRRRHLFGKNYVYGTLRVLVPRGREEEATRLMERFRTKIIEVNKRATYSPPEPV